MDLEERVGIRGRVPGFAMLGHEFITPVSQLQLLLLYNGGMLMEMISSLRLHIILL